MAFVWENPIKMGDEQGYPHFRKWLFFQPKPLIIHLPGDEWQALLLCAEGERRKIHLDLVAFNTAPWCRDVLARQEQHL